MRENRLFCHVPATSINSVALLAGRDDFAVHYKMDPGDQAILLFPVRRKRLPIRCSPALPPFLSKIHGMILAVVRSCVQFI